MSSRLRQTFIGRRLFLLPLCNCFRYHYNTVKKQKVRGDADTLLTQTDTKT